MSDNASHASAARAFGYRAAMDADRRAMSPEPGTYTLGRLFGIPIKVSATFGYLALVLALVAMLGDPTHGPAQVLLLALLLAALVLHELGHALVAQRFGVRVLDIKLWHLGGMARMSDIPEDARTEASIALAGPVVNLMLAAAATPLLFAAPALGPVGASIVANFIGLNVLLGVLNLLPAFPMDGGRVLRALLSKRAGFLGATETAVRVGRWVALGMVIAGTWLYGVPGFLLSLLVAGFVWFAGTKELLTTRIKHTGSPFGAGGGGSFARAFGGANGANPFGGAAGPFGGAAGPFGHAARPDAGPREAEAGDAAAFHEPESDTDPSPGSARRPSVDGDPIGDEPRERRGFSDADVERLERYRGPLRRRAAE